MIHSHHIRVIHCPAFLPRLLLHCGQEGKRFSHTPSRSLDKRGEPSSVVYAHSGWPQCGLLGPQLTHSLLPLRRWTYSSVWPRERSFGEGQIQEGEKYEEQQRVVQRYLPHLANNNPRAGKQGRELSGQHRKPEKRLGMFHGLVKRR